MVAEGFVLALGVVGGTIGQDAVAEEAHAACHQGAALRVGEEAFGGGEGEQAAHVHVDHAVVDGGIGEGGAPFFNDVVGVGFKAGLGARGEAGREDVGAGGAQDQPGVGEGVAETEIPEALGVGHEVFADGGDAAQDGGDEAGVAGERALGMAKCLGEDEKLIRSGGEGPAGGIADGPALGAFGEGFVFSQEGFDPLDEIAYEGVGFDVAGDGREQRGAGSEERGAMS